MQVGQGVQGHPWVLGQGATGSRQGLWGVPWAQELGAGAQGNGGARGHCVIDMCMGAGGSGFPHWGTCALAMPRAECAGSAGCQHPPGACMQHAGLGCAQCAQRSVHRRQHTGGVSSMVCTSPVLAVQRVPGPHSDACTHTVHLRPWMLPACWQQPQGHAQAVSSVQRSVRQQRAHAVCGGAAGVCSVQCTCRQLARSTGRGRAGCVPRTGHPCSTLQHAQQAGCGAMPR